MPDCEAEEDERGRLMGEGEGNRHGEDERRDAEAGLQGGNAGNEPRPLREREWRRPQRRQGLDEREDDERRRSCGDRIARSPDRRAATGVSRRLRREESASPSAARCRK